MAELHAQEIVTNRDVVPELILKSCLASGGYLFNRIAPNRSLIFKSMGEHCVSSGMGERLVVWNLSKARSVMLAVLTF